MGLIAFTTGIGLFYLSSCDFVGGVCVFCSASGFFWLMLAGLAVWVCGLFDSLVCGCCVRFWWGIAFLWFSILGVRDGSLRSGVAVVVVLCCCSGYLGGGFLVYGVVCFGYWWFCRFRIVLVWI